ncbi:MAG: hypothetical protein AUG08_15705 [Acidobacteria bacterium 13_1_20CM_2_55_15]|nr:MAG: hypothetical protein AUG08_15705 [Acidobacteria bacterium 13_1_20CM_2_55_15]
MINSGTAQAVGIIGGTPKTYKTWMALEMAVAVASGSACLSTFGVPSPGPVLLYAAEDSQSTLRLRLESLTHHHALQLRHLDIRVIIADSLRLDRIPDQERLEATLLLHRLALLILDPLVRLHAIDENAAGEIAALLGYPRLLQRKTGAAIALVHHARKNVAANGGAGYSLRGSSDLYAWVDAEFAPKSGMNGKGAERDLVDLSDDEFERLLNSLANYCAEKQAGRTLNIALGVVWRV